MKENKIHDLITGCGSPASYDLPKTDSDCDCSCSGIEEDMPVPENALRAENELHGNAVINSDTECNQWSYNSSCKVYRPTASVVGRLKSGYYVIDSDDSGIFFRNYEVEINKIYPLPNKATEILLNDIGKFWTLKENYEKYDRVFRRNYLIYSEPGTGKTSLISLMCKELIEKYEGIIIHVSCERDLSLLNGAMYCLREIEKDRKVIIIIEDIDAFISSNNLEKSNTTESLLLSILDGNFKYNSVVTIATTNYISLIAERYTNRPSRFDRVIEFSMPNEESRRMFIQKTVKPEDIEKINLDEWVKRTEGYTIDHLNELILLFFVFGHDEAECFETMNQMIHNNSNLKTTTIRDHNKESIGFGFIND